MDRLAEIISELKNSASIYVKSAVAVDSGRNSSVYKVYSREGSIYALKIYPFPNQHDNRKRLEHEVRFIEYLSSKGIENIPRLIASDSRLNYALLSWVDGTDLKSLQSDHLIQIANFIAIINQGDGQDSSSNLLPVASDAVKSLEALTTSIIKRFQAIRDSRITTELEFEIHSWLDKNIQPNLSREIDALLADASHPCWRDPLIGEYISPSDVGIHNTIETDSGLFFIDFEYAGKDDLSKLMNDWVSQPNYSLTMQEENELVSNVCRSLQSNHRLWLERYQRTKKLTCIKWVLIMLRELRENNMTIDRWSYIRSYAMSHGLE